MAAPMICVRSKFFTFLLRNRKGSCFQHLPSGTLLVDSPHEQQVRCSTNKHWDPKWRKYRAAKYVEINLPDFDERRRQSKMDPSERRSHMKKENIPAPRHFQEREILIASTGSIFEPYVPPEGDGKASIVSGKGVKQTFTQLTKKGKSLNNVRKIKKHEEDFSTTKFPDVAFEIYKESLDCLNNIKDNEDRLHDLVTEKAYPEMTWQLEKKTVRWKFLHSLEPPRVVHARVTDMLNKDNLYAQVTVRFHTQQTLAVYDRFGRLLYGSEHLVKDCLEYVVFEKRISELYSEWRVHGKLLPDWLPPRDDSIRTKRQPHFEPLSEEGKADEKEKGEGKQDSKQDDKSSGDQQPQMATA